MDLFHQDAVDLLAQLADGEVDHVITDPPYDKPYPLDEMRRVSRGNVVVFHRPEYPILDADEYQFWIKTPSTKNFVNKCGRFVEQITIFRKGDTFNQLHWSQMIGIHEDKHIVKTIHPYQKPLSLMERLVRIYTNHTDVVLDPYMGSGTTGWACQNLNRNFIGCEIDESWFQFCTDLLT